MGILRAGAGALLGGVLLGAAASARADVIILQNEVAVTGIAGKTEGGMLEVQLGPESSISYPESDIIEIQRKPEEDEALAKSWGRVYAKGELNRVKEAPAVEIENPRLSALPIPAFDLNYEQIPCWSAYGFRLAGGGHFVSRLPLRSDMGQAYAFTYDNGIKRMTRMECEAAFKTQMLVTRADELRGGPPALYTIPPVLLPERIEPSVTILVPTRGAGRASAGGMVGGSGH